MVGPIKIVLDWMKAFPDSSNLRSETIGLLSDSSSFRKNHFRLDKIGQEKTKRPRLYQGLLRLVKIDSRDSIETQFKLVKILKN